MNLIKLTRHAIEFADATNAMDKLLTDAYRMIDQLSDQLDERLSDDQWAEVHDVLRRLGEY